MKNNSELNRDSGLNNYQSFEIEDPRPPRSEIFYSLDRFSRKFVNYSTKHEASIIGSYIVGILLLHCALIFQVIFSDQLLSPDISATIKYIISNLNSDPILDIIPANSSTMACPGNYELTQIGYWSGTVEGCSCQDKLFRDSCSEEKNCVSIEPIKEKKLFSWKRKNLCVKHAKDSIDYLTVMDCPKTHVKCSPGLCFRNGIGCPITSVFFTETNNTVAKKVVKYNEHFFNYRAEHGKSPLISLQIEVDGLPCFDPNESPDLYKHYPLLNVSSKGCAHYGVDNSTSFLIDKSNEYDILKDNGLIASIDKLPGFNTYLQANDMFLYGRTRLKLIPEDQCVRPSFDSFYTYNRHIDRIETTMIVCSILIFPLLIADGYYFKKYYVNKVKNESRIKIQIYTGITTLVIIVMSIILQISRSRLDLIQNEFIDNQACMKDERAYYSIGDFIKFMDDNLQIRFLAITIMLWAFFINSCLILVYRENLN